MRLRAEIGGKGFSGSLWSLGGAAGAGALALTLAGSAHALPLLTLSANLRGLYAHEQADHGAESTALGLGLSGGVTLPGSLYLGLSYGQFFGNDHTTTYRAPDGTFLSRVESTATSFQVLAHVGYDLGLLLLTLRPSLGAGYWRQSFAGSGSRPDVNPSFLDTSYTVNDFILSPGLELLYGLGLMNVSAEVRYDKVLPHRAEADNVFFGIGVGISL